MKASNPLFLKGLNELRAIAALAVLVHHIELFKFRDQLSYSFINNRYLKYFFETLGKNGVYLFFVLSGFLITYLILKEKERYTSFNFKNFYIRRILRIWPLYYIIMLISFFLIPFLDHHFELFHLSEHYHNRILETDFTSFKTIATYFGFLSNYGLKEGIAIVGASQSWSVSIEEQFYLFWPVLLLLVFRDFKVQILSFLIVLVIILNHFFDIRLFQIFQFEYLFIGCLGALVVNTNQFEKLKNHLDNKIFYFLNIFVILVLLFVSIFNHYFQTLIISFAFLTFIVLTVNNSFYFKSKIFDELGKISYGIYMYHPFVMFLVFPVVEKYIPERMGIFISTYVLITTITLMMSYLSYHYIEKKFLKLKEKRYSSL